MQHSFSDLECRPSLFSLCSDTVVSHIGGGVQCVDTEAMVGHSYAEHSRGVRQAFGALFPSTIFYVHTSSLQTAEGRAGGLPGALMHARLIIAITHHSICYAGTGDNDLRTITGLSLSVRAGARARQDHFRREVCLNEYYLACLPVLTHITLWKATLSWHPLGHEVGLVGFKRCTLDTLHVGLIGRKQHAACRPGWVRTARCM